VPLSRAPHSQLQLTTEGVESRKRYPHVTLRKGETVLYLYSRYDRVGLPHTCVVTATNRIAHVLGIVPIGIAKAI
jgi:hypothetical protein